MAIQVRKGNAEDFDAARMKSGELAAAEDTEQFYVSFKDGTAEEIPLKKHLDDALKNLVKSHKDLTDRDAADQHPIGAITNLTEELDDRSPAVIATATGDAIAVSNSSDRQLRGLTIYGKTTQVTTTGKNLLNLEQFYANPLNGLTISIEDGALVLNGTATGVVDIVVLSANNNSESRDFINSKVGSTFRINNSLSLTCYWFDGSNYVTDTVTIGAGGISQALVRIPSGASYVNAKLYVSITEGANAAEYEPYTGRKPSPSPEYPQALNDVGNRGEITAKICGKNLLNLSSYYVGDSGGLSIAVEDGAIVLNGKTTKIVDVVILATNTNSECLNIVNNAVGKTFRINATEGLVGYWYDGSSYQTNTITIKDNRVINAFVRIPSGATFSNKKIFISVTMGGETAQYEPYKPIQTFTAQTPNGLPGIPVTSGGNYTDEEGQQWICDEIDFERGVYVRRVEGHTFTGEETGWTISSTYPGSAYLNLSNVLGKFPASLQDHSLCSHAQAVRSFNNYAFGCSIMEEKSWSVWLKNGALVNESEIQQILKAEYDKGTPVKMAYILATSIETPLTAKEIAAYKTLHTNKPNTTILNDGGAGMSVSYVADTKAYIDNKFAALEAAILSTGGNV